MDAKSAAEILKRHEETKHLVDQIEALLDEVGLPPIVKRYALNMIGMGAIKPEETEAQWRKMDKYFRQGSERSTDGGLSILN